jgi:hypothetical protein
MSKKTDDEILLDEVLEICKYKFTNGTNVLNNLTESSLLHLKTKYKKIGLFVKSQEKYFEDNSNEFGAYKAKQLKIEKPKVETKLITKPNIKIDSTSGVPILNQFLNQCSHGDWILQGMAFQNFSNSQKKEFMKPYSSLSSFLENSKYFETNSEIFGAKALRVKKSGEKVLKPTKESPKIEIKSQPKIETKQESKSEIKLETKTISKESSTLKKESKKTQIRNIPIIKINENEVLELLKILPQKYFEFFHDKELNDLIDIEMDFNRIPKAHFFQKPKMRISEEPVTKEDIEYVTKNLNILPSNRSGIEKYLHRISVIRSIENEIIGITLRVGKPIVGIANIISDILDEKKSILFLGPPGIEFPFKFR